MSCHTLGVECMSTINFHEIVANIPKSTKWACIEITWCFHKSVGITEQWQRIKNCISTTILLLHMVVDAHNLLFQQALSKFTSRSIFFWSFELLFKVLEPLGILLFICELHHFIKLGIMQIILLVHHQWWLWIRRWANSFQACAWRKSEAPSRNGTHGLIHAYVEFQAWVRNTTSHIGTNCRWSHSRGYGAWILRCNRSSLE